MLTAPWLSPEGKQAYYRQSAQADERYTAEPEPLLEGIDIPVHII